MKLDLTVSLSRRVGMGDNDFFEARCVLRCEVDREAITTTVLDETLTGLRERCEASVREQLARSPDRTVRMQAETPEERDTRETREKLERDVEWTQRDLANYAREYERCRDKRDAVVKGDNRGPFYPDTESYLEALNKDVDKAERAHSRLQRKLEVMKRRYQETGADWEAMLERREIDTDDTPF